MVSQFGIRVGQKVVIDELKKTGGHFFAFLKLLFHDLVVTDLGVVLDDDPHNGSTTCGRRQLDLERGLLNITSNTITFNIGAPIKFSASISPTCFTYLIWLPSPKVIFSVVPGPQFLSKTSTDLMAWGAIFGTRPSATVALKSRRRDMRWSQSKSENNHCARLYGKKDILFLKGFLDSGFLISRGVIYRLESRTWLHVSLLVEFYL
ncbi:hypothetical protein L484_004878 [Morus notabilis]|uniref:Uncharacterized protein n=1 Tax=Morus notabilis TaxID=981085 RepID=W9S5T3_9ROSA|nr:hypothetical protein L484_004878 [Morus notabilis]